MNTFLKVILGIVIIGVASVVLLVFVLRGVARNVHVQETGAEGQKTVKVDTPFGNFKVHENDQLDPEHVGIPVYPGATRSKDRGGAQFQFDMGDLHKDYTVAGAVYYTGDSAEKVRDFYRQKFPSWKMKWLNDEYQIETHEDEGMKSVSVKQTDGHTRIAVASAGPPAAN